MPRTARTLLPWLVLLLAAAALAWAVRAQTQPAPDDGVPRGKASAPALPPVPVVLARAVERSDDLRLEVLGSARAERELTLYPAAAGEVVEIHFRAGQRAAAGQLLLRLDDRREALAVDEAAARLDAARRLLARYEATRGTGAVPGSIVDEAESGVALAEIALRQARVALADRSLRAPFAGVVGLARVERGDRVQLDTAITTLDDRRKLLVDFELPEVHAARLRSGLPISVASPAFGERRFSGRIVQIDSRVDAVSRKLRLRAELPNGDDLLRPGMSFQLRLDLGGASFVAVPELALQWGREGAYVWAVREGRAAQVPVRPVQRVDAQVLLDGAIAPGEQVVVEGVQRLRAGRAVTPVTPVGGTPAASAAAAAR